MKKTILGIIPARGGSISIPRKNIKLFLDKPLLAWTVETAIQSGVLDRLILSTDDDEIAQIGMQYGAEVPFLRPAELAQDSTPTAPVIKHLVEYLRDQEHWLPDFIMILEPTSPARRPFHIREVVRQLKHGFADTVISVSEVPHHYLPQKTLQLQPDSTLLGIDGTHLSNMIHRRQDLINKYYAINGLVFACKTNFVVQSPPTLYGPKVVAHIAEPRYTIDLDWPADWEPGETRLKQILHEEMP